MSIPGYENKPGICYWTLKDTHNRDKVFGTECGCEFYAADGAQPGEHPFRFCQGCGKQIRVREDEQT